MIDPLATPETQACHVYDTLELQHFADGPFRDLFSYWLSLGDQNQKPSDEAFDLLELPHLVSDISVVECQAERFLIRYSGANFGIETGKDLTGCYTDEIADFDHIHERAINCRDTGAPFIVMDQPVTWTSRDFKKYSTLAVPLANAEGKIVRLVYIMTYS